jgi:hypothetical protein
VIEFQNFNPQTSSPLHLYYSWADKPPKANKFTAQDLRFSLQSSWKVINSGILRPVVGWKSEVHDGSFLYMLRPWRRSRYVPSKRRLTCNGLHSNVSQKTEPLDCTSNNQLFLGPYSHKYYILASYFACEMSLFCFVTPIRNMDTLKNLCFYNFSFTYTRHNTCPKYEEHKPKKDAPTQKPTATHWTDWSKSLHTDK